ncbi:DNA-binding domain-containing protein [Uliginosibacterium sediminicola]|uniref:DNA-binding domain-containing protein n=1 Tax=Uliginosibacterium sediminicola TaxID=2024550 RepID=A0ABU9YXU1_9RHOO
MNAASVQAEFAAAVLDPERPCPTGLTRWNGGVPARRLAVYRNNVVSSLVDALADTFPVVAELVGEPFFRAMARCFVQAQPPSSPLLVNYGAGFAAFVRDFPPAASLPYLAEVAQLEYARVVACHAADAASLSPAQIAAELADAERAGACRLLLQPSLHCLRGEFAAVSLWAAHQGLCRIESVDPFRAEHALVWRQDLEVQVMAVDAAGLLFIEALQQGRTLGEAAASALALQADFELGAALAQLIGAALISAFDFSDDSEREPT